MINLLPYSIPPLPTLPATLPLEGAIRLELEEGVPIFRASTTVQERIETLLDKQQQNSLTSAEVAELNLYEEIDDYLSFINRMLRNLMLMQQRPSEQAQ
jgi:hypothetical protein